MYDEQCLRVACHFMEDEVQSPNHAELCKELAQHIQDAIEGWLAVQAIKPEPNFPFSGSF